MKIDTISATNLALRTFSHNLAALTIIQGSNASGKSTIKDAILLAATGKHPDAPASAAGIMETFGTGPSLTVAIHAAGLSLSRIWTRTGKAVKAATAGDEALGASIAPAFFAGRSFLSAKPAERANMLRAAYPSADDPKEAVLAAIKEAKGFFIRLPETLSFDAWVEEYTNRLTDEAKSHRATIKRMKGVIQGLEQLASDEIAAPVTTEMLQAANDATQAHRTALGIIRSQISTLEAKRSLPTCQPTRTKEEIEPALAALRAEHAQIKNQIDNHEATNKGIAALNAERYNAAAAELKRYNAAQTAYANALAIAQRFEIPDTATARAAVMGILAGSTKVEHLEQISALRFKLAEATALHTKAQVKVGEAKGKMASISSQGPTKDTCDTCGAHRMHWNADVLKAIEEIALQREEELRTAERISATAAEKSRELQALIAAMEKDHDRLDAALGLIAAEETCDSTPSPQAPQLTDSYDLQALQEESYDLECSIATAEEDLLLIATEAEQSRIAADIVAYQQDASAEETKLEVAIGKYNELATTREAQNGRREAELKTEQAGKELQEAEAALAEAEKTMEIIAASAKQEALKVLEPLLKAASMFTDGILTPPITNTGLAIGRWHDATWQPINRLSGAEQAMVTAALGAALATGEASKIVIIDEFSVIDDAWKPLFLANLRKAQEAGLIEQAIVLDNRKIDAEGWTTIEVAA